MGGPRRTFVSSGLMLCLAAVSSACSSSGGNETFPIGGTISGLIANGLVLTDGSSDTVAPAADATAFTFPSPLPVGTVFTVTVQSQPTGQTCIVRHGTGIVGTLASIKVGIICPSWVWQSGSDQGSPYGAPGVYGTQGFAAAGNVPGARSNSLSWSDPAGNLWLFGGQISYTTQVRPGGGEVYSPYLNDLWKYEPATGQWTWVSGPDTPDTPIHPAVFGVEGIAAPGNIPAGRASAVTWTDYAGNLWLFGGYGLDSAGNQGNFNDLWEFTPGTGEWAWMGGTDTLNAAGEYGAQGSAAPANVPGARDSSVGWTDDAGNFWLFGGEGLDSHGNYGDLNDLWRFTPGTGQWTWMSGADTVNSAGKYGTQGSAAPGNVPGARSAAAGWTDSAGNLWLFGGNSLNGVSDWFNDLWMYRPRTGQWTWVSGADEPDAPGVFGVLGTAAPDNVPRARWSAVSWTDRTGNLWLFGGGSAFTGGLGGGTVTLSDLWQFNPRSSEWTWMGGSELAPAVYGIEGQSAAGNEPGARTGATAWTDGTGNFWLFGGVGVYLVGNALDSGTFNDLWEYTIATY